MKIIEHDSLWIRSIAGFSDDEVFRYLLVRVWDAGKPLLCWIMLNPSTADAFKNDPTVGGCEQRAIAWGYGGYMILNAFAFRATLPEVMLSAADPIGAENDATIVEYTRHAGMVILGWGNDGKHLDRDRGVLGLLDRAGVRPMCLAVNKNGTPQHPLYVARKRLPIPYTHGGLQ